MDILMPSGCVLSSDNVDITEQLLKHGGVEYKPTKAEKPKKKPTKADLEV